MAITLNIFRDKKVLLTGPHGFLGRHTTKRLLDLGAQVYTISRSSSSGFSGIQEFLGDLEDPVFVSKAVKESSPHYVLHLAANKERGTSVDHFKRSISTNLLGTLNLLEALRSQAKDLSTLVSIGTGEEYGKGRAPYLETQREFPVSSYSLSKICSTQLIEVFGRLHQLSYVILRPGLAYGPGQADDMFVPALINSLKEDKVFKMSQGQQTRDMVYVGDLVEAILLAAISPRAKGNIINIGGGSPVRLKDLAQKVEKLMKKPGLVEIGSVPYRPLEIMDYSLDITRARDLLGWSPRTVLDEGLKITIAHYIESQKV